MMKVRVSLAIMGFALTACNRLAQEEPAKLILQTPSQTLSSKLTAQSNGSISEPTSLADINCYGITISGPSAEMSRNSCGRRDDASSAPFKVGKWVMMVPAGSELSIDVPAGKDREIRLIGMKAEPGHCMNLGLPAAVDGNFSEPYVLGTVSGLEMKAGATMEVSIPMAFDANKGFNNCVGPDFTTGVFDPNRSDNRGDGNVTPTQIALSYYMFPSWRFLENTCTWIHARLADAQMREGKLPNAVTASVRMNGVSTNIYSSPIDCENGTNGSATFSIPANEFSRGFYIKTPTSASAPTVNVALSGISSGLTATSLSRPNGPKSGVSVKVEASDRVLPDICYPGKATPWNIQMGSSYYSTGHVITLSSNQPKLTFYADSSCSVVQSSFASDHGLPSFFFYKFASDTPRMTDTTIFSAFSMSGSEQGQRTISVGRGTPTITYVDFQTLMDQVEANSCSPYPMIRLTAFNDYGAVVPAPAGGVAISVTGMPSGTLSLSPGCGTDPIYMAPATRTLTMPAGATSVEFYASFSQMGQFTITTQTAGSSHSSSRPLKVNGANQLVLQASSSSSTKDQCVPISAKVKDFFGNDYTGYLPGSISFSSTIYEDPTCMTTLSSLYLSPGMGSIFYIQTENGTGSPLLQTITGTYSFPLPGGDTASTSIIVAP